MKDMNKYIDQTMLRPDATEQDVRAFLEGFKKYLFHCACVNPCWIEVVRKELPAEIKVCSVVGFPLGASSNRVKALAAEDLVKRGCDEIDMVMNIGRFKGNDFKYVAKEIKGVVAAASGRIVKVIIETCLLNDGEKAAAANIIRESGAQYVKTSTGFNKEGARIEDVKLLRRAVGPNFGIKASGGIRDYQAALAFINAGANRLGTSAGEAIMEQARNAG
jgi:deoxyribose-phosphate aldolase